MNPANESFICSASVLSYERRGKETWYNILIVPRQEPCYTIHRRYQDFVHLSNQLILAFPQYGSRKKYQSCFPCRQGMATDVKSPPPSPVPAGGDLRSFKDHYNHHYHRIMSSCSLPRLSSSILLTPSSSSSTPSAKKLSSSLSYASNDRFLQLIANRKKRQKQLDRYLFDLFRMPAEVHQSSFLFEFLNFRPFLFFPLLQTAHQQLPPSLISSSSPVSTSSSSPSQLLTSPSSSSPPHPAPQSSLSCPLFPRRYSKSLPPSPTLSHVSDLPTPITSVQEPSSSQPSISITKPSGNYNIDNQVDLFPNSIIISLYLGPGSFVSTACSRHHLQFDVLRRSLNQSLSEQGLESLPTSSVLAYNHIATSDRRGALETLTLNQKEPWMEYDHVMELALSHRIAFFASTLPVPENSSLSSSSSSVVLSSSPKKYEASQQKQQKQPTAPATQWNYNKTNLPEDDNKGRVLLISCDKDLQAALNGKWRRLDHVTLSCLAW
ncbi:hypothetical protein BCR42DRAFT_161334 [Absidia repens]|uniref:PX domain-containing protein n=1 Tax=Absidia repens TaxID=90262 RepID=A0A1X2ITB7_9FUNG|nr:hypothetical protein BCR42DRAFT_161334 [Absidia repens]